MRVRTLLTCSLFLAACGSEAPPPATDGGIPSQCVLPDDPFEWPVPTGAIPIAPDPSWKNDIEVPWDGFFSPYESGGDVGIRWVKFIVLLRDPTKVYFHDANVYPFHYDFAAEKLAPFAGMSRAEFDRVTLYREGQEAILGAVLVPYSYLAEQPSEYGIQLVIEDEVHPELVRTIHDLVVAHVQAGGLRSIYLPNDRQAACLDAHEDYFAAHGIVAGTVDRWYPGDACYSRGWAIGKLVRLVPAEVDAAWLDGRLRPEDLLLLDGAAPAELPPVGGVLTLAPSTPNSHAAILARSYGVPFAYLRRPEGVAEAAALEGRHVVVQTTQSYSDGACHVRFIDAEEVDPATREEIRALGQPAPVDVRPIRASGTVSIPAEDLGPADLDRVGGKAAHFGLLRDAIPEASPSPAIALTFDVWSRFLAQPAPGGAAGTLGDEIARRLAAHPWPPDLLALDTTLDGIRTTIRSAPFPQDLATDVRAALAPFDAGTRVRFRSSTNVEDSDSFTGAGLYDSATGCLADDLDGDTAGPSLCNPGELEERGVYRAIQKVFASFYRRNAVFERMRRGVDERDVGMAILVHYSVPDEDELANGVATAEHHSLSERTTTLVTQQGALSVANPDGTARAEVVRFMEYSGFDSISTVQSSSLLPLGDHVLAWEDEYRALAALFRSVADAYRQATGRTAPFTLDFEYKKVEPGALSVKQVRPLPLPDTTRDVVPYFIGAPRALCVFQGEAGDVFALHRLKARLALDPANLWLDATGLATTFYDDATIVLAADGATLTLDGDPATFPGAAHSHAGNDVLDSWSAAQGAWTLTTQVDTLRRRDECPVLTIDDAGHHLSVLWASPVPFLDWDGSVGLRSDDFALLVPWCPGEFDLEPGSIPVDAVYDGPAGVQVETSYWWPPPPTGPTAGYTAPLVRWEQTTITGLTSQPIVLRGYYSQSYRPHHHNFGADYIFEPRLEPGLSAAILSELAAADIAYLYVTTYDGGGQPAMWVAGLDGTLRPL